jgi:uncharacterized cupin superfamily protein
MATILRCDKRDFQEDPNKIDSFRLYSDISRRKSGITPKNLNFDLRLLNPAQFSAPYHYHRYAEELFMVVSGSMTLRTSTGLEIVTAGDLVFCEMGENGAHQFYNHTEKPCTYLDIRTFIGFDVCEYPDSGKILIAPSFEIFDKESTISYFDGEKNILERWKQIENEANNTDR